MGFRDFLSQLRKGHRARSKARSEANFITPTKADLAVLALHTSTSTPDLGIGPSTLPTPSPLAAHDQGSSDSTQTISSRVIRLNIPPHNTDNIVSDPTQSVTGGDERLKFRDRIGRGVATNENTSKSNWKSTSYASAKMVVDVVKESSDVFPPLKSAVGGLAAVLKHYDVCHVSLALLWY